MQIKSNLQKYSTSKLDYFIYKMIELIGLLQFYGHYLIEKGSRVGSSDV